MDSLVVWENMKMFFTEEIWEPGHGDFWGGVMAAFLFVILAFFRK